MPFSCDFFQESKHTLQVKDLRIESLVEESEGLRATLSDLESQLQYVSLVRDPLAREMESKDKEGQQSTPEISMIPSPQSASSKRAAKKKAKKAGKAQPSMHVPLPPPSIASESSTRTSPTDLENSKLREHLNSVQSLNVEYKTLLSQLEQRLEVQESEMMTTKEQLSSLHTENEGNLLKLSLQQQQIADSQIRIVELENQLTIEMNNEQSVVERELNRWEEVNVKYQDALHEWDVLREEYQLKETAHVEEISSLRRRLDELASMGQEENVIKDKVIKELRFVIQKLQEENATLSTTLSQTDQRTSEFEQSIEIQEAEMSALLQQISEIKLRKIQLQENFTEIMTKYESEAAEQLEVVKNYEMEIDELKQRLCAAERTISQLQSDAHQDQSSENFLLQGAEGYPSAFEEINESQTENLSNSALHRSEESELQQMRALLEIQNKDLIDELFALRASVETERNQLEIMRQRISDLECENHSLEAERVADRRTSEGKFVTLERDFEGKVAAMRFELEQSLQSFNEEKSRMEIESEERWCQREEEHTEKQRALEKELHSWKLKDETNENIVLGLREENSCLKEQMKNLQESKKGVEQKLKKFALELKNKHSVLIDSQSEASKLQTLVDQRERELKQSNDELELQRRQSKERIVEMEAAVLSRCQEEKEKLEAALAESLRYQEELESELKQVRQRLEDQEALSSAEGEWKRSAENKLKKYALELKTRGATVKELTESLSKSQELVTALQHQLQEAQILKTQQVEELNRSSGETHASQLRIHSLELEVASLQHQLEETRRELCHERDELQQEFRDLVEWKKTNEVKLKKYALELKARQEIIKDFKGQQEDWLRQRRHLEDEVARLEKINQDLISSDELENELQRLRDENSRLQRLVHEGDNIQISDSTQLPNPFPAVVSDSLLAELNAEREGRKVAEAKVKKYALELRGKLSALKELKGELERTNTDIEKQKSEGVTKDQELREVQQQLEEIAKARDTAINEIGRLKSALEELDEQRKQEVVEAESKFQKELIELQHNGESQWNSEREGLLSQLSVLEDNNLQLQSEIGRTFLLFCLTLGSS